ncbi:MAG: peptidoglycan DD-metalloendopeptidase family protein [Pseudomonadales bacterium]|nr:peptidoglycan DD-metalloendopeptidase family protein [Pseudomonadales bacterium]
MTLGRFPRTHLLTAVGLTAFLTTLALLLPDTDAPQDDDIALLLAPETTQPAAAGDTLADAAPGAVAVPASEGTIEHETAHTAETVAATRPEPAADIRTTAVRPGDSLSAIFKREGLSAQDLHLLMTTDPLAKRLRSIFPGQQLKLTVGADTTLDRFEYAADALQTLVFVRDGDRYVGEEVNREPERIQSFKHGLIENSLFLASQRAGLNDAMTMRLAQIFQWDIDFVLDIRRGDEFSVLFEELYVDGEFIGYGNILAAEFVNRGRSYQAVRYSGAHGDTHYYSPDGRPMRQAFLRAPVEFSRISSNFNMNRRHPLFNRNMPHRGIDYAAPTGTPILAAGDGRVATASRTEANGNYVILQHGQTVTTKYLHLSRFAQGLKQGARVRQGQVIGYVGATGWASGPHLHYEFLVNGVHQNPRTVKLPQAEPIPRSEIAKFKAHAAPLLAALNDQRQQQQIALAR